MNLTNIILAVAIIGGVGLFIGLFLGFASRKFHVYKDEREEEIILRNADNIEVGLSKFKLKDDIIVYRNDKLPQKLNKRLNKFLSTSAMPKAVIGKVPNVAIIVPRGSNGGYVELIADEAYRKQREFVINSGADLELVKKEAGLYIYKLR